MSDNQLIAQFMGLQINTQYGLEVLMPPDNPSDQGYWTNPKYDTSWDWLMPVVEKINGLDLPNACIEIKRYRTDFITIGSTIFQYYNKQCGGSIGATNKAVLHFIKLHNTQAYQP